MNTSTETIMYYIIAAGILSIVYGFITGRNILNSSSGNAKMLEIASAIQEGARAYLNRQYKTIAIVLYCLFKYALAPSWIADAISNILELPELEFKIFLPVIKP